MKPFITPVLKTLNESTLKRLASVTNNRQVLSRVLIAVAGIAIIMNGCECERTPMILQGEKVVNRTNTFGASVAYSNNRFGIIYAHEGSGDQFSVRGIVVDRNSRNVIADHSIVTTTKQFLYYATDYLSNVVWNADNNQFAFAYSDYAAKRLKIARLNADMQLIGITTVSFPGLNQDDHPQMLYPSIVYNAVKHEYGVTYVSVEDPYAADKHDDVYVVRINPTNGGVIYNFHAVDCPDDCMETSVAVNDAGKYAVAYGKGAGGGAGVKTYLGVVNLQNHGHPSPEVECAMPVAPNGRLGMVFDANNNKYVILGSGNSGGMLMQCISKSGTADDVEIKEQAVQYGSSFDVGVLSNGFQVFWGSKQSQIVGQAISCSWISDAFPFQPPDNQTSRWGPSVSVVNDTSYVCWHQQDGIYFGYPHSQSE